MQYIYQRGRGAERRVMHLSMFDPRTGSPSMNPLCGESRVTFNTSCNLPLGRPTCKLCLRECTKEKP
jgi:hypothetical protein